MATAVTEPRNVGVSYRAASFKLADPSTGMATTQTLEQAVRAALSRKVAEHEVRHRWHLRCRAVDQETHFTNHLREHNTEVLPYVFGDLLRYRAGQVPSALEIEQDAAELQVFPLSLEEKLQLIEATTFWLIQGNHVLQMALGVGPRGVVEAYLDWLLREHNAPVIEGARLVLADKIIMPKTARRADVREIRIGGHVSPLQEDPASIEQVETRGTVLAKTEFGTVSSGRFHNILGAILGSEEEATKLTARIPADAEMTLDLRLGFRAKGPRIKVLPANDLAEALRNVEGTEFTLETANGRISGDELRLSKMQRITMINGLPDRDSVCAAMVNTLSQLVSEGYIALTDPE